MPSICFKEIIVYLRSPIVYVLGLLVTLALGLVFFMSMVELSALAANASGMTQSVMLVRNLFVNLSLGMIVICPLISMRLFAEERAFGTLDLLLSYPLRPAAIVYGKFLASLTVVVALNVSGLLLCLMAQMVTDIDWLLVLMSFLGLTLMAAAFLSIGVLMSSLTSSQLVAAAVTLAVLLLMLALGRIGQLFGLHGWGLILSEAGLGTHLPSFLKGEFRLKDAFYYLAVMFFCLTAASYRLERRA